MNSEITTPPRPADPHQASPGEDHRAGATVAPGPISLTYAALRSWWLILLLIVIGAAAGIAAGLSRSPEYRAQSQLNVGSLDARAQAIPGFVTAANSLASAYSRMATTEAVLAPVAERLRLSPSDLQSRVEVTPLVNNPIIRVTGKGNDEADARKVTTAVTSGIIAAVNKQNAAGTQGTALLTRFRDATTARLEAEAKLKRLRKRRSTSDAALQRAETELSAARLAADTAGSLYSTVQAADTGAANVERLQPATDAGNDRKSKVEQLGFVGVVAGLVVGLALALMRESRRRRRLA